MKRVFPEQTSRLLREIFLVGVALLVRVFDAVQRLETVHPLCSRNAPVQWFDFRPKNRVKIVVVQTEVARETARDGKSANETYGRVVRQARGYQRGRDRRESAGISRRCMRLR